ncbi:hypothetical protein LF887_02025 [Chryseobacterium sp. MEBOG06]|uniref:hypothetical protein n=1 Tax=Chryseobacterium sp. MEBOG06 TaxID=2879938 RepID=UPI001F19CF07|nr:hypothetical protein [Chryseobacterium sp. MEBOG06]UKB84453.1 hypothetical protein LF887_02025 [Chryseobacterium sp. MEBOG06]
MGIIYKIILLFVTIKAIVLGRKYSLSAQGYLMIYLLITFLNETISWLRDLIDENSKNGLQYNIYIIFSIIFFYFFFKKIFKSWLKHVFTVFFLCSIIYILIFTNFYSTDFDSRLGICLVTYYIIVSLFWYYQKLNTKVISKITVDPNFWVSTALLLWSSFSLFRIIPMYFLEIEDKVFLGQLKFVLNLINGITYFLFYVALIKYEKQLDA